MVRTDLLLGAVLTVTLSSAAMADPPIGSRLGSRLEGSPEKVKEAEAAKRGHEYATCLVNKREPYARRLLAAATPEEFDRARRAMNAGELNCYTGFEGGEFAEGRMFYVPSDLLRGLLAEQMLKREKNEVAALAPLPRQQIYKRLWFAATARNVAVDEMATCVAETAPAQTMAVFSTVPYSDAEGAAMRALSPSMGPCLSAGAKLHANRQSLRAALADALYQRLHQPAAAAPPTATK